MPTPIDVTYERTFSGTTRRIFQLLTEMGTSADAIWPFASQPFIRSAGPLTPGVTEEWHLGLHSVLDDVEPERRIVWRIDNDGVDGTHGFSLEQEGRRVVLVFTDGDDTDSSIGANPVLDEARNDSLYEMQIAFDQVPDAGTPNVTPFDRW